MSSLLLTGAGPSGAGGAFTPASIAGLAAWYDASAITGLANADPVATWSDSSGNGLSATQATLGNRPSYRTNQLNGKPVVRFDGIDDYMTAAGVTVSQPDTVFVVYKAAAVTAALQKIFDGTVTRQIYQQNITPRWECFAGATLASATGVDTNAHVHEVIFNGASSSITLDGVSIASGNAGANALTGLAIGVRNVLNIDFLQGDLAEMLFYSGALSGGDRSAVRQYLGAKWGVSVV